MNYERIATLIASGLTDAQVATIIGVSPARISQIKKEEDFFTLLSAKQTEVAAKDVEEISLTAKYTAAEHLLIEQVTQMAPVSELRDVTAALRVIAERQEKAKSRMNPVIQGSPIINNIVQLSLPAHAIPEITLNSEKEVIAIGQRNLAPLSSQGVLGLFNKLSNTNTIDALTIEGNSNGSESIPGSAKEDASKALPKPCQSNVNVGLSLGASKFLDSLHPAPFASVF